MAKLPKVITTSVIRTAHKGESHGGVYIVDLEDETHRKVIDWNDDDIDWEGRGGERGLRGISFYKGMFVFVDKGKIYLYDSKFNYVESFVNKYLKYCHEIHIEGELLYLTSTGYDSILVFNLNTKHFIAGYHLYHQPRGIGLKRLGFKSSMRVRTFDPNSNDGPVESDIFHINNVFVMNNSIFISGTRMNNLYCIVKNKLVSYAKTMLKTHNARPFEDGVLFNNTASKQVVFSSKDGNIMKSFPIKIYNDRELINNHLPDDYAVQAFGRGLCVFGDNIIAGSSPATISVFSLSTSKLIKTVNLTMDVRNTIHGLEIIP